VWVGGGGGKEWEWGCKNLHVEQIQAQPSYEITGWKVITEQRHFHDLNPIAFSDLGVT
jgi:hypothetical protein